MSCKTVGLALAGSATVFGASGLTAIVWTKAGEKLLLIGSGIDLVGVGADLAHEGGLC